LIAQAEAKVIVHGANWDEAHQAALSVCRADDAFLHPFDDPLIWEGHASMIDEIVAAGVTPDGIILSVGGGGLLCGVAEGVRRTLDTAVPILAVETKGAASFYAAISAGALVGIPAITSLATSLGAKKVAQQAFDYGCSLPITPHLVSDEEAVQACTRFLEDHRLLVEPACGASLAALYRPAPFLADKQIVVVIVCGGVGVSLAQLQAWTEQVE
jgi:L-serine/L-threonine ammonia-lyase